VYRSTKPNLRLKAPAYEPESWRLRRLLLPALLLIALGVEPALAAPGTVGVQGVMTATSGPASDGKYSVHFALYDKASGGVAVWSEGPVQIAVFGGRFDYALGTSKPLDPAKLGAKLWLGVKIASDPELSRSPLHAVTHALRSALADDLACSGCVGTKQLKPGAITAQLAGFTYAGAQTKGGPADKALDLSCTGCVSVKELALDADVDLKAFALKAGKLTADSVVAATVSAAAFIGDGSKLTGIKTPAGTCKNKGEVVKGINPDGSLLCVPALDPSALPADGIDEISNGLIHNQFTDAASGTPNLPIQDNNPVGTSDTLTFPDVGLAQKLTVSLDLQNSRVDKLTVKLYDPANKEYTLYKDSKQGKTLVMSFPYANKTVSGDLTQWIGSNPKGKWRLVVIDAHYTNNKTDGTVKSWSVAIQTLSSKKIRIKGDTGIDGNLAVGGTADVAGLLSANGGLKLKNAAAEPFKCSAAHAGYLYFNTTSKRFFGCNGKRWVKMQSSLQYTDIMSKSFGFTSDSNTGGNPKNTADKVNRNTTSSWGSYCIQSNTSSAHWVKVDFGAPKYIEAFGVAGYPGSSHKPKGTWHLQGSTDNKTWKNVWSGGATLWTTGSPTYPPPTTIEVTAPGQYRYYRIYSAGGWTNGHLLVCNWAMYE
jgi:subtilisin-like proprotein convertase family protein